MGFEYEVSLFTRSETVSFVLLEDVLLADVAANPVSEALLITFSATAVSLGVDVSVELRLLDDVFDAVGLRLLDDVFDAVGLWLTDGVSVMDCSSASSGCRDKNNRVTATTIIERRMISPVLSPFEK